MVSVQDAHDFIANGWKMLEEWNRWWGTGDSFSHRVANVFLDIGLIEVSADCACGEMLDMIRKGRKAISQLESIVFIDLHLIQADEFQNFWIETIYVIEGLNEQVTRAGAALEPHLCLTCK